MVTKLLSLLSTAKGAAAAGVIAAAGLTTGVVATNTDVQNALGSAVENVTGAEHASPSGQPAVVASRNDADRKIRSAFQNDQQKLEKLRGTQVAPSARQKLDSIVGDADDKLRARLQQALDDVAALTLGREGLEASGSPKSGASAKPSLSPDVKIDFIAATQAKIDDVVKTAIANMDKIASDATAAATALPTFQPGKPSDGPGGKPSDVGAPGNRPTAPATPSHP